MIVLEQVLGPAPPLQEYRHLKRARWMRYLRPFERGFQHLVRAHQVLLPSRRDPAQDLRRMSLLLEPNYRLLDLCLSQRLQVSRLLVGMRMDQELALRVAVMRAVEVEVEVAVLPLARPLKAYWTSVVRW